MKSAVDGLAVDHGDAIRYTFRLRVALKDRLDPFGHRVLGTREVPLVVPHLVAHVRWPTVAAARARRKVPYPRMRLGHTYWRHRVRL